MSDIIITITEKEISSMPTNELLGVYVRNKMKIKKEKTFSYHIDKKIKWVFNISQLIKFK